MIDYFIIFLIVQTIKPQYILDQVHILNNELNQKLELNPLFKRNCINDRERLCKLESDSSSPQSDEILSIANEYLSYFGNEDPEQYQRLINQIITQYAYRQDEYQTYALAFQGLKSMIQHQVNISIGINSKEREIQPIDEKTNKTFDVLITFENLYLSQDGKFIYTKDKQGFIYFNSSVNLGTIKMNSSSVLASYFNKKKRLFKTKSMVELFGAGTETTNLSISANSQIAYITFMIQSPPLSPQVLKNKIHYALQQRFRQLHLTKNDFIEQFIKYFLPKFMLPQLQEIIQNMLHNKPIKIDNQDFSFILDELKISNRQKLIELDKLIEQLLQ